MSRAIFVLDFCICYFLISSSRIGIRLFFSNFMHLLSSNKPPVESKKVIIIGAGYTGQVILRQTLQIPNHAITIIGFLDDDNEKNGARIHDVPVIGKISDLNKLDRSFDEIFICIPSADKTQMRTIIDQCRLTGKPFNTLPSFSELVSGKVTISQLRPVSLVDLLGRDEIVLNEDYIQKFLKGKRILVTGAGGSIGSELVRQCIKYMPSAIILLDFGELNLFEIERETSSNISGVSFKPILSDIRDYDQLENVFLNIDTSSFSCCCV